MNDADGAPSGRSVPKAPLGGVGATLMLGWQIAVAFVVYPAIGYALDLWLKTQPWLLLVGLLLGFVAVFARIHRMVIETERRGSYRTTKKARDAGPQATRPPGIRPGNVAKR